MTRTAIGESDEPLDELAAVERDKRALAAREAAAVRRARLAGYPWAAIAMVLGVSKQAVHKKYGRRT